jgi:NADH:ubiquinone oxidoreductase subunit E
MDEHSARIEGILQRFPQIKRNALIPILQAVQDEFGYISGEAVRMIGSHLDLPASKVYGLATFYNQFSFSPRGKYHLVLCNGTSCHLSGAAELLDEVGKLLGIKDGGTTHDGLFSLEIQSCIGACGQSPVLSVNGRYYPGISVKEIREIINQYREHGHG